MIMNWDLKCPYCGKEIDLDFTDDWDYDKMFFSFRPVKIEKWYTPSECEIIEKFSTDD